MYNVGGLLYRALVIGLIILLSGILILLCSKFWNHNLIKKKEFVIAIIIIIFAILYMMFYFYKAYSPIIAYHEGYLSREYRDFGMTYAYCFSNGDEKKLTFYLDIFSKKKIYISDFSQEIKYKIYYERDTYIILGVEEIED